MPEIRSYVAPNTRTQIACTSRGFITETFDIRLAASTTIPGVGAATGNATFTQVGLRAGDVVTNLVLGCTVAGTGVTFAKMALYSVGGAFIMASSSLSAQMNSGTGYKTFALTTPYTVPADNGYMVGYLQYGSGATGATIIRALPTFPSAQFNSGAWSSAGVSNIADLSADQTLTTLTSASWFGIS